MASFFQKWIDLIIKTSSISSELLEALMVQMAGIEPARFIQPQDFKSCASTSSATSAYTILNWLSVYDNCYYNMNY
jgi:hypothetical protein